MFERPRSRGLVAVFFAWLLVVCSGCESKVKTIGPRQDYEVAQHVLEQFIVDEMATKGLPALSIALVDDQEIVWARGFGFADPADSVPASSKTVYRVGSVSKLFTDIAVMQLVERNELDLDAPITRYLPDFNPTNDFGVPITLRHLMSHRSGLVREPPMLQKVDQSGSLALIT
jgi:CubicO group peptidase (beta-lactamase class C family)